MTDVTRRGEFMREIVKETILQVFLTRARLRHRWENRRKHAVTEDLKKTLRHRCEEAAAHNLLAHKGVYNVGLFIAVVDQDMSTYNECLLFARSEWHRNFHARGLALLLFEAADDLPQLLGKDFRQWLLEMELGQSWVAHLNSITKKISLFRKSNDSILNTIRNHVIAHRTHDAVMQMDLMRQLSALEIWRMAADFTHILKELVSFHIQLLRHADHPWVMVRSLAQSQHGRPEQES